MPWHLENRDGKVCVIKDADGSVAGCHDSRTDAIKQQRALYANEARMASMYSELDAQPEEEYGWVEPKNGSAPPAPALVGDFSAAALSPRAAELVEIILNEEREKHLTASLTRAMDVLAQRMESEKEERTALVAAISQISNPVVHVAAPEITVEAAPTPEVKVEVAAPEVTIQPPDINVAAPEVTVRPQFNLPQRSKTVTFERDPLTNQVTKAEVVEGGEQ
jgi:hypothetical protein